MIPTTTLDTIAQHVAKTNPTQDVQDAIHDASLLALTESVYRVVNARAMPTPLFRSSYDAQTHHLTMEMLGGRAPVPNPGELEVGMLDLLLGSLLRDRLPILLEGKTGIGKTYTVEQFFKTILPQDNHRMIRLNPQMSNVLQPYTEGVVENGLIKIRLRTDELDRIAAIFIDEKNRGDSNQVLQLQDGTISLATGERGDLGIPILETADGAWQQSGAKRPPFIVSAQNPPASKDAKYSATRRTDAAQNNRDLQVDMPNGATEIGAGVLLMRGGNGQFEEFLALYRSSLTNYLDMNEADIDLATLRNEWPSIFAFTTDPSQTSSGTFPSGLEFIDAMITLTSPDLAKSVGHEQSVSEGWSKRLHAYKVDFAFTTPIDADAIAVKKIQSIVGSFEEEFVTRDTGKVKKLADVISTIRRIKTALGSDTPLVTYRQIPAQVTIEDLATGFAVLLHDKQEKHEEDPVTLVDAVLREYVSLTEAFAPKVGYRKKDGQPITFSTTDLSMSIYTLCVHHAMLSAAQSPKSPITGAIKDLGASVAELRRLSGGVEYRKPLVARVIADIATFAGFLDQYQTEITARITPYMPKGGAGASAAMVRAVEEFYRDVRTRATTPDMYKTRLARVLGA